MGYINANAECTFHTNKLQSTVLAKNMTTTLEQELEGGRNVLNVNSITQALIKFT